MIVVTGMGCDIATRNQGREALQRRLCPVRILVCQVDRPGRAATAQSA